MKKEMTALHKLRLEAERATDEFFERTRAAEDARPRETAAAITIQSAGRGFLTRKRLDAMKNVVTTIQRVWRGYLGRQRAHQTRETRNKMLREVYFAAMAIRIQRHWRGFWSRKYVFDFYARKQYLERVAAINATVRSELQEEGERAAHAQKAAAEAATKAAFADKVSKLHHLLSTASQPGIFNSPFAAATGNVPVVAGAPVEDHLRMAAIAWRKAGGTMQQQQRSASSSPNHSVGKGGATAAGAGGGTAFLPPIKGAPGGMGSTGGRSGSGPAGQGKGSPAGSVRGPMYPDTVLLQGTGTVVPRHYTLRQSVPYDTVHKAAVIEDKVVKAEMLTRHPVPFRHAAGKPEVPTIAVQSNRNLLPYNDPWDPTVGNRNETFTPTQRTISPQRFTRYPHTQTFFDGQLNRPSEAEALPPPTYVPPQPPPHAAGVTSADLRRMAKQPA